MIRHTVVFKLKHAKDSPEEKAFFEAAQKLAAIPEVHHFESLQQVSKKNNFDYCFSMEFDDQQAYDDYNKHPDHVVFVKDFWVKEVADFMEIDYTPKK